MPERKDRHMPTRAQPTIATLILLTGATTLSLNMFLPSLVNIAAEFGADYALASTSIAGRGSISVRIGI